MFRVFSLPWRRGRDGAPFLQASSKHPSGLLSNSAVRRVRMDVLVCENWASGKFTRVLAHIAHNRIQNITNGGTYCEQSTSHSAWELVLELNLQSAVEEAHEVVALNQVRKLKRAKEVDSGALSVHVYTLTSSKFWLLITPPLKLPISSYTQLASHLLILRDVNNPRKSVDAICVPS